MDRTEPTELIYVPNPSWSVPLVAAAIALLVAGTFMGWFLWLLGGVAAAPRRPRLVEALERRDLPHAALPAHRHGGHPRRAGPPSALI